MATQQVPGQTMVVPLPRNTAKPPPTIERSKSDIPPTTRKEAPLLPSSDVPKGRKPSQPEPRPPPPPVTHVNGRPPSKSEPPPPPRLAPQQEGHGKVSPTPAPPSMNGKSSSSQAPTIRSVPGSTVSTQPREGHKNNNDSTFQSRGWEMNGTHPPLPDHEGGGGGGKRRPSLPTSHTYPPRPAPSTTSQSHHRHTPSKGAPQPNGSAPSLGTQDTTSSSRDRQPSPNRSKSLKAPPPLPPRPPSQILKSAPQQPPPPAPQAPKQLIAEADDLFSRIEQDIARNHPPPPVKEKGGDERARDKGRKLFGKALEHIKHGGEKIKEKKEKERK
ncbi:hypothetical protein EV426DRAFT_628238 [Tirmania nivea]|nr:hypothetical protein EV426DRAFT_628238 [Tirmania nivea]